MSAVARTNVHTLHVCPLDAAATENAMRLAHCITLKNAVGDEYRPGVQNMHQLGSNLKSWHNLDMKRIDP